MKKRAIAFRLSSISGCCRVTGLAPCEAIVGAAPNARHRLLIAAYREAASGKSIVPLIVTDIRAAVARGANSVAAELFVVLREILAARASLSAELYPARRRDRCARLRRAGVRTLPFPVMIVRPGSCSASVLPFVDGDR